MSAEAHRPADGDTAESPEEAALARVLESYLANLEAGRPADPDRLIAAHPELAGPLRACLKVMHLAAGLSHAPGRSAGPPAAGPDGDGIAAPPGVSALTVLWPHEDLSSRRLLPEPPEDDVPVVRVGTDALPDTPEGLGAGRYQVLGEIARGGMGVVLRARDVDLGRDLALKVLQARHRVDPGMVGRFIEEARIGGQLQHPGIVPVHELGTLADRRPYFTMKLVKGRTLGAILAERPSPEAELPRFLAIFEQVCQTLAYAHARRVIHRDLKPANVMVGSFGEVQVVDWGLAKVLPEGGIADEAKAMAEETGISTARGGPSGSDVESQPGSVLGTPSYMAPEQARGDLDRIDERADVFGLGAILCEILTGRPPFGGSSRDAIRTRAARGDLTGAFRRLDACKADAELIGLARDCLEVERERRPRHAGEVARRMSTYQAGVQERLRVAERARIAAQTRAEEERKRRRMAVALAASILGLVLLGGGGRAYLVQLRMERARRMDRAASVIDSLYADAKRAGDDLSRWAAAREAAYSLEQLLADAADASTRSRLTALIEEVARAATSAENDQKLLAQLVEIRAARGDDPDGTATDSGYADAFREAGLDLAALPPPAAGAVLRTRPEAVRIALATSLDDWSTVLWSLRRDRAGARRLTEVARLADPDPWRNRLRALSEISSPQEQLNALKELAGAGQVDTLPAVSLYLLGASLNDLGDAKGAETVLRNALRRYPGDIWLNYALAVWLERQARLEEAIRYFTAARSLRPETAHALAHALQRKGERDQAISVFEDLVRLRPEDGRHLLCLGKALKDRGRNRQARDALDAAVTALRAELRQHPGRPESRHNLGIALHHRGKSEEAIVESREALRLKPDLAPAHITLGAILSEQGKLDEAIAELRTALRLGPDSAEAHITLGAALHKLGKLDEAIAELRTALRLKPDSVEAHTTLGAALHNLGKLDEAMAECRLALQLHPDNALAHYNLALALKDQGKPEEAATEYRKAIQLKPEHASSHYNLANILRDQGMPDEAIIEYREAIRCQPDSAQAHCNLGQLLRQHGRFAEALAELRRGHELGSKAPNWRYPSAQWVREAERLVEIEQDLPAILAGKAKPTNAAESLTVAQMCYNRKLHGSSARFWVEAFQSQPQLMEDLQAQHRYNAACAAAMAGCGQGKDDRPLDDAAKARWREQAIDWLRADLTAWTKILESGPPQARPFIAKTLQHWKADTDLAGLRDPASLDELPEGEQAACRALWKDVDKLLAKAAGIAP